jgi:hypothetical protein
MRGEFDELPFSSSWKLALYFDALHTLSAPHHRHLASLRRWILKCRAYEFNEFECKHISSQRANDDDDDDEDMYEASQILQFFFSTRRRSVETLNRAR